MSGKKSRLKGHNYERKIRRELIDLGFENCTTSRFESLRIDASGVDLCNTDPFNIQCKAIEKGINYSRILDNMPKHQNYNIVLHKKNRKEVAVMSKRDFYRILELFISI